MKTITIANWTDLATYCDKYQIPKTCSMAVWLREVLQGLADSGTQEVEISFAEGILPKTYLTHPYLLANITQKHVQGFFPHLQGRREQGTCIFRASQTHRTTTFLRRVSDEIKLKKICNMANVDIPQSYIDQPYTFLAKLRTAGINHPKLTIEQDSITYYVD